MSAYLSCLPVHVYILVHSYSTFILLGVSKLSCVWREESLRIMVSHIGRTCVGDRLNIINFCNLLERKCVDKTFMDFSRLLDKLYKLERIFIETKNLLTFSKHFSYCLSKIILQYKPLFTYLNKAYYDTHTTFETSIFIINHL